MTPGAETSGKEKRSRLLYIDNIRILLICLVIATHTSITYGGPGSWFFTDPGNGPGIPFLLIVLDSLNQSFFMGFFILISAYFIPGSLTRKGMKKFAHDRIIRLGIPLAAWILLIAPFLHYLIAAGTGNSPGSPLGFWASYFIPFHGLELGPMWFVFFLLIATTAYLVWIWFLPGRAVTCRVQQPFSQFHSIVALGLLLGFITAVVRIFLPIGTSWYFMFQPPFFPQYIGAFIIGIYAARNSWLDAIPARVGKMCALVAVTLVAIQPLFLFLITSSPDGLTPLLGGLHWQAIAYAFWDQMACVMIVPAMLWASSLALNRQGPVTRAMAGDSYTVYIIHPVVLISISLAMVSVAVPQLAKFAIVLFLTICASFILAHGIRAIPGVNKVL